MVISKKKIYELKNDTSDFYLPLFLGIIVEVYVPLNNNIHIYMQKSFKFTIIIIIIIIKQLRYSFFK